MSVGIMVAYNAKVKKLGLIGNALVSTNVAVPFIYGGFASGSPSWSLAIFALLACLSNTGREIMKGIVDVAGDTAKGVKSVAATKGNAQAGKESALLILWAVLLSVLPILFGLVSFYYIPLVAICDIGFLLTSYSIVSNPTPENDVRRKDRKSTRLNSSQR